VTILIWNYNFAQTKDSLTIVYYSTGKVKFQGKFTEEGLKNGEFIYYASDGSVDSSITFKKGKLDGLKKIYFSDNDIFYFDYKNNKLLSHKIYDSINQVKYISPIDIKRIPKTTFQFASGRDFYDHNKTDTLTVNQVVPYMNQNVYFPGATVRAIGRYSWEIKSWSPQPNSSKGKMVIDISQFNITEIPETATKKSKSVRHEVILILIK
jgi:hypothetical protein